MYRAQCSNLNSSFYAALQPSSAIEETGTIFVTLLLCVALCCVSLRSSGNASVSVTPRTDLWAPEKAGVRQPFLILFPFVRGCRRMHTVQRNN